MLWISWIENDILLTTSHDVLPQAKFQIFSKIKLIPWNLVNLSHLYFTKHKQQYRKYIVELWTAIRHWDIGFSLTDAKTRQPFCILSGYTTFIPPYYKYLYDTTGILAWIQYRTRKMHLTSDTISGLSEGLKIQGGTQFM